MRTAEMIEQEGRDLAGWLMTHSDDFPPLQINGRGTPQTPAGLVELARESAELRTFALGSVQLKGLREDADYDHRATFGRDVAIAACRTARRATEALEAVYGEPRWASFATLAILRGTR
jgi:hypothetical protein